MRCVSWLFHLVEKNILDGKPEVPGQLKGQQDGGFVAPVFQRADRLPRHAQRIGQFLLADAMLAAQLLQTVFRGRSPLSLCPDGARPA